MKRSTRCKRALEAAEEALRVLRDAVGERLDVDMRDIGFDAEKVYGELLAAAEEDDKVACAMAAIILHAINVILGGAR